MYDSDEDKALLGRVYVNENLTCLDTMKTSSIPTSLCSLCNDDSCDIQPTCRKCFETKPTFLNKNVYLYPHFHVEEAESLNSVNLPIHVFIQCDCVCVFVHACTSGNTFVFKVAFQMLQLSL